MDYTKPEVVDSLVKSLQQKFKNDTQVVITRAGLNDTHTVIGQDIANFYNYLVVGDVVEWFENIVVRDRAIAPEKTYHLAIKQFNVRPKLGGERITVNMSKFLEEKKVESGRKCTAKPKKDSDRETDQGEA